MINVFLSRPNWVSGRINKQLPKFYSLLRQHGFDPKTIGKELVPITTPFDHVVTLMRKCDCTIVLGLPQTWISAGRVKGKDVESSFSLATDWNQIEAAMSLMLRKPTLMMAHKGVAPWGLFERGAANVFVHEFHTLGNKWIDDLEPKLMALREAVASAKYGVDIVLD